MNFAEDEKIFNFISRKVSAKKGWQKTGISYKKGDKVVIEWDGHSQWCGNIDDEPWWHGPAGPTRNAAPGGRDYPLPGRVEDSLVGRLGGGDAFFIGEGVVFDADRDGELAMTINDNGHYDNAGEIGVRIQIP